MHDQMNMDNVMNRIEEQKTEVSEVAPNCLSLSTELFLS